MITVLIELACDRCHKLFRANKTLQNIVFRQDLEDLRKIALGSGWRRFRETNRSSNGDYCPACARVILAAKERPKKGRAVP